MARPGYARGLSGPHQLRDPPRRGDIGQEGMALCELFSISGLAKASCRLRHHYVSHRFTTWGKSMHLHYDGDFQPTGVSLRLNSWGTVSAGVSAVKTAPPRCSNRAPSGHPEPQYRPPGHSRLEIPRSSGSLLGPIQEEHDTRPHMGHVGSH